METLSDSTPLHRVLSILRVRLLTHDCGLRNFILLLHERICSHEANLSPCPLLLPLSSNCRGRDRCGCFADVG